MNKKRKILMVVALAMFSVIIALHYGFITYIPKHNYTYIDRIGEDFDYHSAHGKVLSRTPSSWGPDTEDVKVEWPGYFHLGDGLITDVRMPLFVLGVFYVGLFAILGDNKRKEQ
jgi:hypothetical protein